MKKLVLWIALIWGGAAYAFGQWGIDGMSQCGWAEDSSVVQSFSSLGCPHPCPNTCTGCNDAALRDAADPVATGPVRRVRLLVHLIRDDYGNAPVSIQDVKAMLDNNNLLYRGVIATQYAATWGLNWPSADTKIDFCYEIKAYDQSSLLANSQILPLPADRVNVVIDGSGAVPSASSAFAHLRYWDIFDLKSCAHEIGHALGLLHTHERIGCSSVCRENFLPGTDRNQTGDYCSDTDPEPADWGPNCALNTAVEACSGVPYTGSTKYNIMSYAPSYPGSCESVLFTTQQTNRMRCTLVNSLSGRLTTTCADWVETDFATQPGATCLGGNIQFLDRSVTLGTIVNWDWDFGDGFIGSGPNPVHAYAAAGTYSVRITATTASGLVESRTRALVVKVGSAALPYQQDFDAAVGNGLPSGWECKNLQAPLASWHRIRTLTFSPGALSSPNINNWFSYASQGQPSSGTRTEAVVGPTGNSNGGAMAINNTVRQSGANRYGPGGAAEPGTRDTLLSPVFDLSTIFDPQLKFYYAHIPAGSSAPGTNCGWEYPGFVPSVPGVYNIFGNASNHCGGAYMPGQSYPECVDNKISVKYSLDCGATWLPLTDTSGRSWNALQCYDLNTEPGMCCPFGFVPKAASNWDVARFNLCQLGAAQQVRFMFEYEHSGDNNFFWVDDFGITGSGNPWGAASTTVIDAGCGGGLGSLQADVQPAGAYTMTLVDAGGAVQAPCVSAGSCTFGNLVGQAGGKPYTVYVADGSHCGYLRDSVGLAATIPLTLSVSNTCQTQLGGSITVNHTPVPGVTYTYTATDASGAQTVSSSPVIALPHIGSYVVTVQGNPGGLCGSGAATVTNTGNLVPQFSVSYACYPVQSATVVFSSPVGSGYTYQLFNINGVQIASSTNGSILVPSPYFGTYVVKVIGLNDCGEAPLEITSFSTHFDLSVTTTPSPICSTQVGTVVATTSAPGVYQYSLINQSNVTIGPQSTGTFTGLIGGTYRLVVKMLSPYVECETQLVQVAGPTNRIVQSVSITPNSNCTTPNGQIRVNYVTNINFPGPWTQLIGISNNNAGTYYNGYPNGLCGFGMLCTTTIPGLPGGQYQLDVSDPILGCSTLVLTVPNNYGMLQLTAQVTNGCSNPLGSVAITALNPVANQTYSFVLRDNNQAQIATGTSVTGQKVFTGLASGQYTVDVTRNGGVACGSIAFIINNGDFQAPHAVCQPYTAALDSFGQAALVPANINNSSTDNCGIANVWLSTSALTCNNLGLSNIRLVVQDFSGLLDSCTATVTLIDTLSPVARCGTDTVALDAQGLATITAAQADQGSSDNCGLAGMSISTNAFNCADLGLQNTILTVTDAQGHSDACTANIWVVDQLPPVANCQSSTLFLDANGQATLQLSSVDASSTDNCGIAMRNLSRVSFGCADLGAQTVVLSLADASGNASSCAATVTVADTIAPMAICQNALLQLDSSGTGNLTVASLDGGSSDNCGLASVTLSTSAFSCAQIGAHSVVLIATDLSGNTSTCTGIVNVTGLALQAQAWTDSSTCGYAVSCAGAQDGVAHVQVQGGCPSYTYFWSNGMSSANVSGLAAGSYMVTVQDGNGALAVSTVVLNAPAPIAVAAITDTACAGMATASIDLQVSGGNDCQGYAYHWSNGATTEDVGQIVPGTYVVTITDGQGCIQTQVVIVPAWPEPLPAFTQAGNLLTATQGLSSYQWLLNGNAIPGATSNSWTVQQTGSYALAVVDSNGCLGQSDTAWVAIVGLTTALGDWEQLQLYPNPARDEFRLRAAVAVLEEIDVQILDICGRQILAQRFAGLDTELTVGIQDLAAGSYLVEVATVSGKRKLFRLVVQ